MESLLRLLRLAIQRTSWTQLGTVSTQCSIHVSWRNYYDGLVDMSHNQFAFIRMSSEEPQKEDKPLHRQFHHPNVYPWFIRLHTLS